MNLKEVFNNGDIIRQGNNYDEILAGLTMQPSEAYDTNFVSDVSQQISSSCAQKLIILMQMRHKPPPPPRPNSYAQYRMQF